ncbi:TIGR03560 family F420-dependent LLM class oxidoreductase [Actinospica durhamensis]|uniref:TIGR03560 family F420-dependent LLM class oxidoreductase n=1 Tax=Actinospica durhamensis TaxID=1508375 RepID=A0A941ITK8_9ACTN|nr:TIGR03560 family F420-dependent LLM class oxidoreductase [Actinospica durhamensis]
MRLRILAESQDGASYDDLRTAAVLAEELGFDGFFTTDHYLPLHGRAALIPPLDAWTTLAGLARETSTIRLGTLVTPATFRLPGPLGVIVAQVNAMSGGRAEIGLGAGWYEAEHKAFGLPFPDVVTRFDRLEEQLEILTGYWRAEAGQSLDFHGRHFQLEACPAGVQAAAPTPRVILGGHGKPRGLRLAARWADEFNIEFPRPGVIERVVQRVHAACDARQRDPETLTISAAHLACVGDTREDLAERAQRAGLDLSLDLGALIGTVDEVAKKLADIEAAGVSCFYLQVPDLRDTEHLRTLSQLNASPR